jgi:hypothetical protein
VGQFIGLEWVRVGVGLERVLFLFTRGFLFQRFTARIVEAGVIYHVKKELVYLGVDIAKSYLDAAVGNEKRRFSNDMLGHRELIKWVKQINTSSVQVICESSGGYERALVQTLARAHVKVSLVQANRVRQFARRGEF